MGGRKSASGWIVLVCSLILTAILVAMTILRRMVVTTRGDVGLVTVMIAKVRTPGMVLEGTRGRLLYLHHPVKCNGGSQVIVVPRVVLLCICCLNSLLCRSSLSTRTRRSSSPLLVFFLRRLIVTSLMVERDSNLVLIVLRLSCMSWLVKRFLIVFMRKTYTKTTFMMVQNVVESIFVATTVVEVLVTTVVVVETTFVATIVVETTSVVATIVEKTFVATTAAKTTFVETALVEMSCLRIVWHIILVDRKS